MEEDKKKEESPKVEMPRKKSGAVKYGTLVKMVSELTDIVTLLNERIENLETAPPVTTTVKVVDVDGDPIAVQTDENSGIIKVAQNVLGKSFLVETVVAEPGISFQLKITPPEHLREHKDDVRIRTITNIEGESGARLYAEKVKAFCIKWANDRGVTYEQN